MSTQSSLEFDMAPLSVLDYGFTWTLWLAPTEVINSSNWVCSPQLTLTSQQISLGVTSVFVNGGVVGNIYQLTNTIVTNLGRTDSRTMLLSCKKR